VHPPAAIAPELGGEPKTENWFVVETKEGSAVLAGLEPGTTRAQFEQALRDGEAEPLVCRLPTKPGDSLFVESGRLHAIDGGNLILEIQQNSDTTYRVYDWGRVGLDGQPRQLHVDESLASIDFDDFSPALQASSNTPGQEKLVESEVFHLHRLNMTKGSPLNFAGGKQPRILSLVQGKLRETRTNETLLPGDNALIPYTGDHAFVAEETSVVLVTDHFVPLEA